MPILRTSVGSRRARPRRTARCLIPSTWSQVRSICSATAEIDASFHHEITSASYSAVKAEFSSAQGTRT